MASSADKPTTGHLKKIIGAPVGEMIPLYNKDVTVGRTKECDVRIRDPNVSRSHCILNYSPDGWSITDLGGINGTYLDSEKLVSHVQHPLKDGMGIYLGPPSDAPIAFVFIRSKNTEKASNTAKETLQSKDVSPQSDNSTDLQSTQSNLKKRSNPTNHSSQSKKHAPSTSNNQPVNLPTLCESKRSRPRPLSSDSDDASDVSICSLDSLRTRIRKMNSHKKIKSPVRDNVNVASTSASPPLRSSEPNFEYLPSTSSANQAPKVKKKSKKTSEGLKNMKETVPGAYRELETLFNDETDSLTDSVNGREDSESLLTNSTALEHANSATLPQTLENDLQCINNQAADTTLSDKMAQKEKMKEQIKRAKARMKLKEDEEKKKLEIEASTSKKDSSEKLGEMLEEELICNICTEVFIKATTLGCSHTFCEHCITLWKRKQKRCPICREVIASQTRILIMDNFIDKVVEKLDKDYQDKRKEVIASREAEKANEKVKKHKRKKASRSRNSRRSGSSSSRARSITNYLVPESTFRAFPVTHFPLGVPYLSSGSERDEDVYCYICGELGHPSVSCPSIM
ncbi:hypothetical protein JTE90_023500 [Oedothorax gibbosus]|uniref:E3 ubiquitin-protein ligase CHFR n=1 Tax=Oedothorax gibbosus TaxID=931172 RepID=A0AAV6VQ04_9ARAC|nr:hypothetical protein JTE90_023500 [Oedothorax gibbosus]